MTDSGGRAGVAWRLRVAAGAALVAAAASVLMASGASARLQVLAAPSGLTSFDVFPGDATTPTPTFSRTPALAWKPVRGATQYQVELSTNKGFRARNGVVWSKNGLKSPVAAVPISLPWMASAPLYWRVRAFGGNTASGWSSAEGFRVQPTGAPRKLLGGPGFIKWSAVPGATGYQVSFQNRGKVATTVGTAADLRGYYGKHAPAKAVWRVRAVRRLFGSDDRSLPETSYGPWSATYSTPIAIRKSGGLKTVSTGPAPSQSAVAHKLQPVFLFPTADRATLHHVYVASDVSCKKLVLNSAVIRGSAFTPRSGQHVAKSGHQAPVNDGPVLTKAGKAVVPSEAGTGAAGGWARVDLSTGRYFWTVVPVERKANGSYQDTVAPEVACRTTKGVVVRGAGKPALGTSSGTFATGLSPLGSLFSSSSAQGRFYGPPLVAWRPVTGATRYEVQWSRSENPWRTVGTTKTFATSSVLPLNPGTWWYRVRGLNSSAQGEQRMSWSKPVSLSIATPTFAIVEN